MAEDLARWSALLTSSRTLVSGDSPTCAHSVGPTEHPSPAGLGWPFNARVQPISEHFECLSSLEGRSKSDVPHFEHLDGQYMLQPESLKG